MLSTDAEERQEDSQNTSVKEGVEETTYLEPQDESLVEWLVHTVKDYKRLKQARDTIINRHFGELNITVNLEEQEKLLLINEYINKDFVYPSVFLGSSLGFNKNNWNKNIEKVLEQFNIKQKPVYGVKENCLLFEKLKYLILKYIDTIKK
ncbi:hypothetical protein NEOKW01_0037 [Nematocida sp. AWRm80]|nr:hypothetical protein NEOKW01_0037 [Nematocida sp. AWRm80]